MPTPRPTPADVLALAQRRGPEKTFCPSEVARALAADWRPLMPAVRAVANALVERGELVCTQGGIVVDPRQARGPLRYRLPRPPGAA